MLVPSIAFIWKVVHFFSVNILRAVFYERGKKKKSHLGLTGKPVHRVPSSSVKDLVAGRSAPSVS